LVLASQISFTSHPQRHTTVFDDLRLRYVDVGVQKDEPPLLLLHGLASRIEEYDELINALGPSRRVIAFDLPGNGYSDKPDRPYSLQLMEDAALALLDQLGIDHANVAGGSLGGNLTLRLGHRQPDRFLRLAAWAPGSAWEPKRRWTRFLSLLANRGFFWPTIWIQSRFWYHPKWNGRKRALEHAFAHFREVYCRGFVRMYWDLAIEQLTTSLFPIAGQIRQPTLLLWGDQDSGLDMGAGVKRLSGLIPHSKLIVFPDARHSLANEVPALLGHEIDAFLRNPPGRAQPSFPVRALPETRPDLCSE
jgi:pimeloyl-ACP methyl ester carboxylesterase